MKKIKVLLFSLFVVFTYQLINVSTLFSLDWGYAREDGGLPGAYLSWGAGARSLAMGKAYVALSDDASAVYWNSAGLTQLKEKELTALYSVLWEKTNYSFLSYTQPIVRAKGQGSRGKEEEINPSTNYGTIGIALVNLASTGFNKRNEYNEEQGNTGLSETAGIISYAKILTPGLSGGINLKVANQHIDTYSDTGYGLDVGFLWKAVSDTSIQNTGGQGYQMSDIIKPLSIGLCIQNLIAPNIKLKDQTDKFPRDIRLGLAYRFLNDRLTLAVDADKTDKRSLKMHYGIEFSPHDIFAIRCGLDETEITAGFGVEVAGFSLDYAFAYQDAWSGHEDLGNSHRFGLTYRWGNIAESRMLKAESEDESIGDNAESLKSDVNRTPNEASELDAESENKGIAVSSSKGVETEKNGIDEEKLKKKIAEAVEKQTGQRPEEIKIEKIEEINPAEGWKTQPDFPPPGWKIGGSKIMEYTVVKGDCLWNIAKKPEIYSNPLEWPRIYEANRNKIKNPNLIYPGQIFVIPRDVVSEAK